MAELPAYSGRGAGCMKCGTHGPDRLAPVRWRVCAQGDGGRRLPCKDNDALAGLGGEQLCRLCGNCGYGWPEACTDNRQDGAGRLRAVPDGKGPAREQG